MDIEKDSVGHAPNVKVSPRHCKQSISLPMRDSTCIVVYTGDSLYILGN